MDRRKEQVSEGSNYTILQLIGHDREAVKFDSKVSNPTEGVEVPLKVLVKELVWEGENSDEILLLTTFGRGEELMKS